MSDENQKRDSGWTEAALDAVISWFPGLPKWVKVIFASATIYLVLCLVAQVSPVSLFSALGNATQEWVAENRKIEAEQRGADRAERSELVALLLEQNRELRNQAVTDPGLAERVRVLERKMDAILSGHPADKARYEAQR